MRSFSTIALAALLLNTATAAPVLEKRVMVTHTVVEHVVKTVDIYTTIYLKPGEKPAVATTAPKVKPQVTPAPAAPASTPTTTTAAPVAPATTSTASTPVAEPVSAQVFHAKPAPTSTYVASSASAPKASTPASSGSSGYSSGGAMPVSFKAYSQLLPGASFPNTCASSGAGCTGPITYFNPSQGAGACGYKDATTLSIWEDSDDVVAIAHDMMGTLSSGDNMNPFCNNMIKITNPHNGKSATGRITDKCQRCTGEFIDLSPHLFDQLADEAEGIVQGVHWAWA